MVSLRKLEQGDAVFMLEWMQDSGVTEFLHTNFGDKTLADCQKFIENADSDRTNMHFAICEEDGEYLGTVSLKNKDMQNQNAEYAITLRNKAIGRGIAGEATRQILRYGFEEWKLNKIYLYVYEENKRAIRFYEKTGFVFEGKFREHIADSEGVYHNILWYSVLKSEFLN